MTRQAGSTEPAGAGADPLAGLRSALTPGSLAKLAGQRSFERGLEYATDDRVGAIDVTPDGLTGIVRGGERYRVWVGVLGDQVLGRCDCPMGEDGRFCKHQVALALAWLEEDRPGSGGPRSVSMQEVREYLMGLDQVTLVGMLLAEADRDDAFRHRLSTRTATSAGHDHGAVRRAIDQAVRTGGYVPYREAWDFVTGVMEAAGLIDEVRLGGDPTAAIDLAEHALRRVEGAMEDVDDSDGGLGDVLRRLEAIHLAACEAARPDPVVLAATLFDWELHHDWGVFDGAVERYADVLGDEGVASYRARAEAAWARVPVVGPGGRDTVGGDHFRITRMMEGLERLSGDTDALIAVMSRDLAHPYDYLEIAEVCREAGRADDALGWAERGIGDFPGRADGRLRDFLIEEYRRRGRTDDAIAQAWAAYTELPTLGRYESLKGLVHQTGAEGVADWPGWRDRAIDCVREAVLAARRSRPTTSRGLWAYGPDGSVAVQIHLAEGDLDAAWATAGELGCSRQLWLDLAGRRADTHPADSIAVYQREIEAAIGTVSNPGYAAAIDLVGRVVAIMDRSDQAPGSREYLLELRVRHGRKRNLIKLLDRLEGATPSRHSGARSQPKGR